MTKLLDKKDIYALIAESCPNGVERKRLGDCLSYEQPSKYLVASADYDDGNTTPVLTAGKTFVLGYTAETNGIYPASTSPCIIFDDFTTASKWVDFDFKAKSSAMKMLTSSDSSQYDIRYLWHILGNINYETYEHARHWISVFSEFPIPVPPLAVQESIVSYLDRFSQLEAELEAELMRRQKQYEWYRTHLLDFKRQNVDNDSKPTGDALNYQYGDEYQTRPAIKHVRETVEKLCPDGVEWKKLGDAMTPTTQSVTFDKVDENSFVSTENLLANIGGVRFPAEKPESGSFKVFISGDILISNIRPYLRKIWMAERSGATSGGDVYIVRASDVEGLSPRFLYHCLAGDKFFNYATAHSGGGKMPRGNKASIKNYPIPFPPLAVQEAIVELLDKFDTLINDISSGIPAELAARRKQYEHYREELLSFEEKTKEAGADE